MADAGEKRVVARTTLAEPSAVHVDGLREAHLRDLSLAGAQIEHLTLGRLGAPCTLTFPPPFRALSLPASMVWCTVIGRQRKLGGLSHLVARRGLRFPPLTVSQQADLTDLLQQLAPTDQRLG